MHTPTASRSTRRSSIGGRGGATLGGAAVAGGRDSLSDDELLFASFSKSHHHQQQKQQDQPQEIAGLSLDVISNLKLVALNKRLKIRNYRTSLRQSILAGETDDMKEKVNTGEETAGASQRKKKNSIHTSDSTNMDPRIPEVIRNPILKFETENIRWQAVIEGELEKFLVSFINYNYSYTV
jgi:hypothetical protein